MIEIPWIIARAFKSAEFSYYLKLSSVQYTRICRLMCCIVPVYKFTIQATRGGRRIKATVRV
jgi:hypothetical protein